MSNDWTLYNFLKFGNRLGTTPPTPYSTLIFTSISIFIEAAAKNQLWNTMASKGMNEARSHVETVAPSHLELVVLRYPRGVEYSWVSVKNLNYLTAPPWMRGTSAHEWELADSNAEALSL